MKNKLNILLFGLSFLYLVNVNAQRLELTTVKAENTDSIMKAKVNEYARIKLTTDMSQLTNNEKEMIRIFIQIADIMDQLYWLQTYGEPEPLLKSINSEVIRQFVQINYGPWDRLDNDKPFTGTNLNITPSSKDKAMKPVEKMSKKPLGANFYPKDMNKDEFEALADKNKTSQYTVIRRNVDGKLEVVWYHEIYKEQLKIAAELMDKAIGLSADPGLTKYLTLRKEAFLNSDYFNSDMAWMNMKNNRLDFVVGPIENYEDGLFEYKSAFEAFVLVKDMEWSKKLDKYIALLPELQKQLPVKEEYKKEIPGTSSDLGVYDAVYYAGDCNAGSKTIAINLPNDERVQKEKGSRRLQLKNTMQAKFEKILLPIAQKLIDPTQLKHVKFDAFFNNVMFHEVAHGLGIKNTINGKGTVRDAMKDVYSAFEEAKADILGLYMTTKLIEQKQIDELTVEDCYVTFIAGIFRSVRFGASSSHGKANMMCFNFLLRAKAFERTSKGTYIVNYVNMKTAVNQWAEKILVFQGNGDYDGALTYLNANAVVNQQLQNDLTSLRNANIPKDVVFEQGEKVLGL